MAQPVRIGQRLQCCDGTGAAAVQAIQVGGLGKVNITRIHDGRYSIDQLPGAQLAVAPQPLTEPPVRDMDEAMEMFGPAPDGAEPLLKPAVQPLHFHASRPGA